MELLLRAGPPANRAGLRALFSSPPEPAKPRDSDYRAQARAAQRELRRRDRCPPPLKQPPTPGLKGKTSSAEPQTPSPLSGQETRQPMTFQFDRSVQDPGYNCPDSFVPLSRLTGNLSKTAQKESWSAELPSHFFKSDISRNPLPEGLPAGQRKPTNKLPSHTQTATGTATGTVQSQPGAVLREKSRDSDLFL